ncbi:MAG: ComEC/Rec2 family competence protein [Thermodesulfobacteriaceae bacterium]|nr:ComEC/Rec2 family competence protein [Thermodesulfobacteriaceae bacterium]MDW8135374.1 ComEC/Rec2 family competence protein [Thermodesulfobacterium sp.]
MVKEVIYEKVPFTFLSLSFILGLFLSFYQVPFRIIIFLLFLLIVLLFKEILQNKTFLIYLLGIVFFYQVGNFYFKGWFQKGKIKEEFWVEIKEVNPWYNGYLVLAFSKDLGNFRFKTEKLNFFPGQNCLLFLGSKKYQDYLNPFYSERELRLKAMGLVEDLGFLKKEEYVCAKEEEFNLNYFRFRLLKFSEKLEPLARGLFQALVLGVEVNLPQEYIEKLKTQGLYHHLAISGFNLAVLYLIFYKIIKVILSHTPFLKLGYPVQLFSYFLALPGAFLVLLFSGFCPSALRAFILLILFVFSKLLLVKTTSFIILLWGVTLILIFEPYLVGNLSFQLSVISTLGIILGNRIFNLWIEKFKIEILFRDLILKILKAFFISWLISFLTFPFLIYYTGFFPIAMPINNLIATPIWSFLFIPISILGAILSFLKEDIAIFLLNFVAHIFELYIKIPFFELNFYPNLSVNLILFAIFLSLFLTLVFKKIFHLKHLYIFHFALFFICYFLIELIYNSIFFIVVFDVGKANAILLKSNSLFRSSYFLFDTGPNFSNSSFNWTKIYLVPSLRKMGIRDFELIIVSHPDLDHSGGLRTLKEEFWVKRVLSGPFEERDWEKANLLLLPERISNPYGLSFSSFELFLFPGKVPYEELNRESLVVYVEHLSGLTFLLPGDIDVIRFYRMIERGELLRVELLLAPHHGSYRGLDREILERLGPQIVIVSGRGKYFPHPETIKLLDSKGIFWVTTEKEGALYFFPKREYFLVCSEREKRKNFIENWLFPIIPALIEVDHCFKFNYHKN